MALALDARECGLAAPYMPHSIARGTVSERVARELRYCAVVRVDTAQPAVSDR